MNFRRYGPLSRSSDNAVRHTCCICGVATDMDTLCANHRAEFKRIGVADGFDAAEDWRRAAEEALKKGNDR